MAEEKKVSKVVYSTITTVDREDSGWKGLTEVKERVEYEDGSVEEEKVEAMAYDDTIKNVVQVTTNSVLSFIIEDVYQKGFDGLVHYFRTKREKESKKEESVVADPESKK